MKIIDLLNKIANGEEVPEIIKYNNFIYKYDKDICDYDGDDLYLFDNTDKLNDEVEILEEEKKIPEKLDVELLGQCDNWLRYGTTEEIIKDNELNPYIIENIRNNTLAFQHKINEIIDYLKSKGE